MENNTNSQKKTKKIIIVLAVVFAACAVGLVGAWFLRNHPVYDGNRDLPSTGSEITETKSVSDAGTLRKLLLSEEETTITLTKDIRIEETLIVRGTKKISGNHSIVMELWAEPYESVLEVYRNGTLILDGITVDGNGIANGVSVKSGAGLTCLSGNIVYAAPYALDVKGKALVKNIVIDEIIHTGVEVASRGEVIWEGGDVRNCTNALIHVAEKGYMNISGDSVFEQSGSNGIQNYGKIDMTGGIVREANNYLVYNDGEFNVDYQGKDKDDKLEWRTCGQSGIRSGFGAVTNLNNVYVHDTGQWALRLYETMGGTTATNCIFENARRKESVSVYKSSAELKNIVIRDSLGGIIVQGSESTLDMDGITITNMTKGRGIENHSAIVTGKNISIDGVEQYGISTTQDAGEAVGSVTLSDVVIKNTRTKTAFNSNGSVFQITNAQVHDSGDCGIQIVKGGSGTFNNVKIYDSKSVGLNLVENSKATFNNVSLIRCKSKDSSVLIDKTSRFTMNGKSVISDCEGRGVYCAGSFVMNGGEIFNNGGANGRLAAGVRIDKTGSFVMNGGSIHDNNSLTSGGGVMAANTFQMNGGSIYNNKVNNQGGGIYLVDGCKFTMKGGSILNNTSEANGGAIYAGKKCDIKLLDGEINGNKALNAVVDGVQVSVSAKITLNTKFNMGSNMIKINWSKEADKMLLRLEGNKFGKHTKELPLVVYPSASTPLYGDVIECDNAEAVKNLVDSIASGDRRYTYYADGKYIRVNAANADLDVSDVSDIVAVSNFQELKEAVTTTKDKRIIKICADIAMEGIINVPGGTTVQIMDDGMKRTLSRADGQVSQFFSTDYGTGLILRGTEEGKLVLDGACSADADVTKLKVVLQMLGGSRLENVLFTNSDPSKYSTTLFGGYVHQQFADTEILNCTFENAICNAGSAIRLDGKAIIKDSTFRNNQAVSNEAGAIYVTEKNAVLKAQGCTFENNRAVKNGGAIFFRGGAGACVIEQCTFTGNMAEREKAIYGGAIHVEENVVVDFTDTVFRGNTARSTGANAFAGAVSNKGTITMTNCAFDKNHASTEAEKDGYAYGGAILNQGSMKAVNCTFTENASTNSKTGSHGGAIYTLGAKSSMNLTVSERGDAFFKGNTAANWGGAIVIENTALDHVTIQGYTFEGNTAGNGGAVRLEGASGAKMEKVTFQGNKASGAGGAIFADDTSMLQIEKSTFKENAAGKSGGAIYMNANTVAVVQDTSFEKNVATTDADKYAYGGAIFSKGSLTATDCQFIENASKKTDAGDGTHGGAIYIDAATLKEGDKDAVLKLKKTAEGTAVFKKNTSTSHGGAIVLDHTKPDKVEIEGYRFDEGNSANDGGVLYLDGADAKITGAAFAGNSANGGGGAIFAKAGSTLKVTDSTFESNTAGSRGGAVYSNASSVTLSGTTGFTSNTVTGGSKTGGAIYMTGGSLSVPEGSVTTFAGNHSAGEGGAAYLDNVTAEIHKKAVFNGNSAETNGGALYISGGSTTITEAEFRNNEATNGSDHARGGAVYVNTTGTTLNLTKTVFEENKVTNVASGKESQGGAIYSKGKLTVTDCQFRNNEAVKGSGSAKGGAVYVHGAGAVAKFIKTGDGTAIFQGNKSSDWAGALMLESTSLNNVEVKGYTFDGNSAANGAAVRLQGGTSGAKIEDCVFTDNNATGGGGALFAQGDTANKKKATLQVTNGTFTGNTGRSKGGAVYLNWVNATFTGEFTFSGNTSDNGADIYNINTTLKLPEGLSISVVTGQPS